MAARPGGPARRVSGPALRRADGRGASGAGRICAAPADLVFVPNATTGVNVGGSLTTPRAGRRSAGTDLEYGAVDRTWQFLCGRAGATYVRLPIALPVETPERPFSALWPGVTPRTRVICNQPHHVGHGADLAGRRRSAGARARRDPDRDRRRTRAGADTARSAGNRGGFLRRQLPQVAVRA